MICYDWRCEACRLFGKIECAEPEHPEDDQYIHAALAAHNDRHANSQTLCGEPKLCITIWPTCGICGEQKCPDIIVPTTIKPSAAMPSPCFYACMPCLLNAMSKFMQRHDPPPAPKKKRGKKARQEEKQVEE